MEEGWGADTPGEDHVRTGAMPPQAKGCLEPSEVGEAWGWGRGRDPSLRVLGGAWS